MSRLSRGSVFRRPDSPHWWIGFSIDVRVQRESAGTDDREQALAFLRHRLDEVRRGVFVELTQRIRFEDMRELLLENYRYEANRSDPSAHLKRLGEFFGAYRSEDITEDRIPEYSRKRLGIDRVAPATLRRELAVLKRMLRLGSRRLPRVPLVDLPRVDNARQGFFKRSGCSGATSTGRGRRCCCMIRRIASHASSRSSTIRGSNGCCGRSATR